MVITLPTNVHIVRVMVFPIVMYGCESWTIKKAEHWRIDAFELWCWRRLLRVLWTTRRSNQSILKEINPGYSLERLILRLKLQYFGHLMRRADSLGKILMLGKLTEGRRRKGWQRMRWLASPTWWTWVSASSGHSKGQGSLECCSLWCWKESNTTEWLNKTKVCRDFSCKEQASFNFMAAVTISSYYETQGNKICHYLYFFLIYLPWSDGNECHDLCFSNVEFHASFFTLLFFHPHQEAL